VNLVNQDVKRFGSEDAIPICEYLLCAVPDKYTLLVAVCSGGGNIDNITSSNGAIPSRWMVDEAMLAGLEMRPFWGRFKEKVLGVGKNSMTPLYKVLEYVHLIKWEVHSKSHPPLLTNEGETPRRRFSRSVTSFSLVPVLSLNHVTKNSASQRSPADI
jgi:hypothetical protein